MAAKKTGKKPSKKPTKPAKAAPSKKLPPGIETALMIAANEVFYENVGQAVEEPEELLESGDIGSTYQGFHRGVVDAEGAAKILGDVAPWITPKLVVGMLAKARSDDSAADFGCDLVDEVTLSAGIDMAEAIILLALGREGDVNEHLEPYLPRLRPLGAHLAAKMEAGDTDEEEDVLDRVR